MTDLKNVFQITEQVEDATSHVRIFSRMCICYAPNDRIM